MGADRSVGGVIDFRALHRGEAGRGNGKVKMALQVMEAFKPPIVPEGRRSQPRHLSARGSLSPFQPEWRKWW